jgi:hypothetical protein
MQNDLEDDEIEGHGCHEQQEDPGRLHRERPAALLHPASSRTWYSIRHDSVSPTIPIQSVLP